MSFTCRTITATNSAIAAEGLIQRRLADAMHRVDSVNVPGAGVGTGDDRYGFDEAAGTAWVVDGATDVGPIRLFPDGESDAAWFADALSARFMSGPRVGEAAREYVARVIADVNARMAAAAAVDIAAAPRSSWPVAAFVWMRQAGGVLEFVRVGDCVGVAGVDGALRVISDDGRHDDESRRAATVAALSWEEKLPGLREDRERTNTPGAFWPDPGRQPRALESLVVETTPAPRRLGDDARSSNGGDHVLLMSDGLYRLVSPFGALDDAGLLALAVEQGLGAAIAQLRALETSPDGPARYKASDDACGLLLRL